MCLSVWNSVRTFRKILSLPAALLPLGSTTRFPFFLPTDDWLISLPLYGKPDITGNASVFSMSLFHLGQGHRFLRRGVRLIIPEYKLHTPESLFCNGSEYPLWHPAVSAGNVAVRTGDTDDTGDLRIKAGSPLVSHKGIAQVGIPPMRIGKHTDSGRIGEIAAGARGKEIPLPAPFKISRSFPG